MSPTRATLAGLFVVLLVPTVLLGRCLFGARTFVPFDVAGFPPIATMLDADELAAVQRASNLDPSEVVMTFVPELRFARQELEAGRLPQWNPYARFGAPLQATAVVGLNYPPNWLALAHADPQDGLALCAWLSLAIAGALMFGFLRSLGMSVAAATFGAIAFSLSGTLVAQAHFYQRLASLIWLPGMLWSVRAVVRRRGFARAAPAAGLAATIALTWLAGFPSNGAPAMLAAAIYAAVLLAGELRRDRRAAVGVFAWLGIGAVLGCALAAVQLLPMAAFFPESSRGGPRTAEAMASEGLAPAALVGWFAPTLFGNPFDAAHLPYDRSPLAFWLLPRFRWDDGYPFPPAFNFTEYTIFVGTITIPLAVFAAFRPRRATERGVLVAVIVLVLLAGGYAWLAWLHGLPGMRSVPAKRFTSVLCGLLAVLAASGLDRILAEARSDRRRGIVWFCGCGAALALAGGIAAERVSAEQFVGGVARATHDRFGDVVDGLTVESLVGLFGAWGEAARRAAVANAWYAAIALGLAAGWFWLAVRAGHRWRWVAVAIVVADLGWFAWPLLAGRELPVPHDSAVHEFLRGQRDAHAAAGGYTVTRGTARGGKVLPFAMLPGQLVPERIRDLTGFTFIDGDSYRGIEAVWGPEQLFRGDEVWPYAFPDDRRLQHPYFDLIGVRWVLSEDALEHAGDEVGPRLVGPRMEDGEPVQFHVYERTSALPRAFVVPRLEVVDAEDSILEAFEGAGLDPRAAAWVTKSDAPADPAAGEAGARERRVTFVRDDVQELELEVADGPAGWLLLNDTWFSGWSARVGGEPAPLVRANLSMRAVPVPAGKITVVFRYEPPRFATGLTVSLLALVTVLALAALGARSSARYRGPE